MCGIAGIIHLDGSPVERAHLDAMTDALRHRGPDGRGTYVDRNVGLGHRRLAILDLSDASAQPMASEDGNLVIVFNGEIYNFAEKRKELEAKGHTFRSSGDTEVLLRLYEEYGDACLGHLRGMFAFAIYDLRRQTLFMARDRAGKKPLKYFTDGRTFAFASELKALRRLPDCPREIDWEAVHHFLSITFLPAPLTGFRGVFKLPAAHAATLDLRTGKLVIERYWAVKYHPNHEKTKEQWKSEILSTLEESTRLRMVADVPLGAFLSGGIDSTAVVGLMAKLHPKPIKTFSIGSKGDPRSELVDAARVAQLFGTDHHPIELEPDIASLLPEIVATYEEPFGDPSVIPTYLISRETRKTVTVAVSGDGGDENFAGYLRYPIVRLSEQWGRVPFVHPIAKAGTHMLHALLKNTFSYRCMIFQDAMEHPWPERMLHYMGSFTEGEKQQLYRARHPLPTTYAWFAKRTEGARARGDDLVHRAMNMEFETYLCDDLMPKVDLGAMAHGLEVRSPFLDHAMLELTATMPSRFKIRGWQTKVILREILRDMVPEETLAKRKQGFRLPLDSWFRTDLRPFVTERILSAPAAFWNFFDRRRTERFLERYFTTRIDHAPQIWMLLLLAEWLEQAEK